MREGGSQGETTAAAEPLTRSRLLSALWLSQGLSQLSQYAILFTLLVLVVKLTQSSTYTSLLILSFVVPSLAFGMLAGALVDRWGKARVMAVASVFRGAACLLLFFFHGSIGVIYVIILGFATAGQFFGPAVVALIPALVERARLMAANSFYNLTLTGAQFIGMVLLAPLLIKTAGEKGMFLLGAVLFALSAAMAYRLWSVDGLSPSPKGGAITLRHLAREVREGWQVLRADLASILAMLHLTLGSTLVLLFAILVPIYMNDIIQVSPDNAAFVFAPVGVGTVLGLRSLRWFSQRCSKLEIAIVGLVGMAVSLVALSLVEPIADILRGHEFLNPERLGGLSLLVTLTMLFSGPLGFFYSLVNAPAQTVLHERAPADMRGRLFGSQIAFANAISLAPLILVGGITDLLGVRWVLVVIAAVLLGVVAGSALWRRQSDGGGLLRTKAASEDRARHGRPAP